MKRILIFISLSFFMPYGAWAQTEQYDRGPQQDSIRVEDTAVIKKTFTYAVKDTALQLDYYSTGSRTHQPAPCVIFVFGGAFMGGHRDDTVYNRYFDTLVHSGYKVASVSYRLGLKGVTNLTAFHTAPLKKAITMAVEDVYDATNWLLAHSDSLGIDTSKIILSGSSSGAITVLEAEFMKSNNWNEAAVLPGAFKYAGIIAFSGAILSYDGKLKYHTPPAPVLLFHGTADRIVPYNKIRLFNKGLYGSSFIAKVYQRAGWPYSVFGVKDMGHEIAILPMYTRLPMILDFIEQVVIGKKRYQVDTLFKDPDGQPMLRISARELFRKMSLRN
jgi:predicted esterase